MAEAMQAVRGDAYRDQLDHISPAVWAWCVDEAIAMLDWFPTVRELLDLAARAPRSPTPSRALLPPGDRDAIDAERRESTRRGMEAIRAKVAEINGAAPPAVHTMPAARRDRSPAAGPALSEREWEERRRRLAEQSREIGVDNRSERGGCDEARENEGCQLRPDSA